MGKYLRKFETTATYDAAKDGLIKPNVSYIVEDNTVEYNPLRYDIITYKASAKLVETTNQYTGGLHSNAFNTIIKSHTFDNGVGTIVFNDDVTMIGNHAFYTSTGLTSITIPDSVTSIGERAFNYCSGLTNVTMGSGVTSIGDSAFAECRKLTNITIPSGVTSISNYAFRYCTSLTSIDIPSGVTSIGYDAFSQCSKLTNITIPSGVTSIGGSAFGYCSSLTSITSLATTAPSITYETFSNVKTNGTLYVPNGSSGYDVWMGTDSYYLGKYSWTKVEQ